MRKIHFLCFGILVCSWLAGGALAGTYAVAGGQTVSGEPASLNDVGVVFKQDDGSFSERVSWGKLSQDDLKKLAATSAKAKALIEPYLEPTVEEKHAAEKAPIVIKTDYEKIDRPATGSLLKGLFSSGVGLFGLMLLYAANIYAGYEVSVFRARSPGLVCGVSAALPVLGPVIFLSMPTQIESKADLVQEPAREKESYQVEGVLPEAEAAALDLQAQEAAANALPATQHFPRGQFTFNRRFIETKFGGFFSVVRRDADKDMLLIFRAARGEHVAQRISRISADELYIQAVTGQASQEVMIPFLEIQEIILKHKDA